MRLPYFILSALLLLSLDTQAQTPASSPKLVMQRVAYGTDTQQKGELYYADTVAVLGASQKELSRRASKWLAEMSQTRIYQDSLTGFACTGATFNNGRIDPTILGVAYRIDIQASEGGYSLRILSMRVQTYGLDYPFYDRTRGNKYNIPHREHIYAFTDQKVNELADELKRVMTGVSP